LVYSRYDLEKRNWDSEPSELDLPDDAVDYSVIVRQSIDETVQPALAIKLMGSSKADNFHLCGIVYSRSLSAAGSDWAGDDWVPVTTPPQGINYGDPCAWVETPNGDCFVMRNWDGIRYRILGTKDDGSWVYAIAGGTPPMPTPSYLG